MRVPSIVAVLAVAQIGAAWALGDMNTARPGGAFATVEAESAGACERRCADDTLCMAWSFQANQCELKAIVPGRIAREGATSGVSQRAPASMRARATPQPALPDLAAPPVIEAEEQLLAAAAEDDISHQLLGGLERDEDLRARLGN